MNVQIGYIEGSTNILAGRGAGQCTPIRIYHPSGFVETVRSGSKPEHGADGFEVLSQLGSYTLDVLGESFVFDAKAGITFLVFDGDPPVPPIDPPVPPIDPPVPPSPPIDDRRVLDIIIRIANHVGGIAAELTALEQILIDSIGDQG